MTDKALREAAEEMCSWTGRNRWSEEIFQKDIQALRDALSATEPEVMTVRVTRKEHGPLVMPEPEEAPLNTGPSTYSPLDELPVLKAANRALAAENERLRNQPCPDCEEMAKQRDHYREQARANSSGQLAEELSVALAEIEGWKISSEITTNLLSAERDENTRLQVRIRLLEAEQAEIYAALRAEIPEAKVPSWAEAPAFRKGWAEAMQYVWYRVHRVNADALRGK